jgi:hypothetical protein
MVGRKHSERTTADTAATVASSGTATDAALELGEDILAMRKLIGSRLRAMIENDQDWAKMTPYTQLEILKLAHAFGWIDGKSRTKAATKVTREAKIKDILNNIAKQ